MTEYVLLLQRAWQIILRNKVLWAFGLIAVLAGQDAVFNLRGAVKLQPVSESIVNLPLSVADALRTIVGSIAPNDVGVILIIVMIVVGVIFIAIGVIASAALIALTHAADRGEGIHFAAGVRLGVKRMWPLIALRLIFNIPATLLSIVVFVVVVRLADSTGVLLPYGELAQALQTFGLLPIVLILGTLLGLLIGGIGIGADRACVLDDAGVLASLTQGWQLMRKNLTRYLAITGIFISSALLIVFTFACPLAILLTEPIAQLTQSVPAGTDLTLLLLGTPLGAIIGLVLLLVYAFVTAYASIVWTLFYRRYA
jgi:hypothetical protein